MIYAIVALTALAIFQAVMSVLLVAHLQYHHDEIERLHLCVTLLNKRSVKGLDQ